MSPDLPKMMSEAELRQELSDLEKFWEQEVDSRAGTKAALSTSDCYWYIYTRQAYLKVLGERIYKPEDE